MIVKFSVWLVALLSISLIDLSRSDEVPDFNNEEEMERLFAQHGFDDHAKRGGVMCHQGMTSLQSRNHLQSNGCTGADFVKISGQEDFTYCCDIHDACYQICNMSRKKCDADFKKCMNSMCDTIFHDNDECKSAANMYHLATSAFGTTFYEDAQSNHCQCGDMRASNVVQHYTDLIKEFYKDNAPDQYHKFDITRYSDYKSSAKKWANLLYGLYKKYDHSIFHVDGRETKGNIPRPRKNENKGRNDSEKEESETQERSNKEKDEF